MAWWGIKVLKHGLVRHFLDQWNHGRRRPVKWAAVAEAIKSFKNPFLWCVISSFVSTVWVLRIQPATPCGPETLVLPRCFQCDAVWIFCCWTFPLRVPVSAASSINATTWQWEGFAPRFLNQSPSVAADSMAAPQGQEPEPCISTQPVTLEERQHRYLDSSCLYHGQASHLISHKPNLTSSIGIIGSIGMSSQWTVPQEAPFLSHPLTGVHTSWLHSLAPEQMTWTGFCCLCQSPSAPWAVITHQMRLKRMLLSRN